MEIKQTETVLAGKILMCYLKKKHTKDKALSKKLHKMNRIELNDFLTGRSERENEEFKIIRRREQVRINVANSRKELQILKETKEAILNEKQTLIEEIKKLQKLTVI
ncbi:hypothetical protein LOD99_4416 [Oopsacas minuta]|uniref:Uncharacterized protein n=1 Tax=Oopsacas minuta TaxID=111878 RepID=A0AAV7JX34_9METZ|nr:hypothetical protein LOD99_4416 [Oopsacas minuta]